jgi:hypothetical protein
MMDVLFELGHIENRMDCRVGMKAKSIRYYANTFFNLKGSIEVRIGLVVL